MKESETYAIPYKDRKNSYIVVKRIDEAYGEGSDSVVSVGCTLKGDVENPTWKVHIPVDLISDVQLALQFAMEDEKPIDAAIKGKESDYEEQIELFKTYGGD